MSSLLLTTFVLFFLLVSSITPIPQINALYSLYNKTNGESWLWRNEQVAGPTWVFSSNSQLQKDPCNTASKAWQGITCSSIPMVCQTTTCNIVEIDLASYGLKGVIPSDLHTLSSLRRLKLDRNALKGILPPSVGSLSLLQTFDIANNQISGTIPSSIGSLSQLQYCYLFHNQISGPIPSSIGSLSQLQDFVIFHNEISGPIPSSIGSLSQLQDFVIYDNQISGTIPSSIGSLSQLQYFDIGNNIISGTIPSSIGSLSQLQDFIIDNNRISGTIPSSIGSLSLLQYIDLDNNQISGPIPSSIGSLSLLQDLDIDTNHISGTIPSSVGSLSELQAFVIDSNRISGTIPSSVGSLSQLQDFVIYDNQISGTIPSSIGSLSQLQYFFIFHNRISGTIPSSMGLLSQLQDFVIYSNRISGTIPSSMGLLSQLQDFDIDMNQISGTIPSLLSQLQYFAIANNQITGTIPSSIGSLSQLQYFDIGSNKISGPIPSSIGSLSQLQYFVISQNLISGTIPSSVGSLSNLQELDIDTNQISGPIPSTFNSVSSLQFFFANSNHLSGPIPLQLVLLSALQQIFLQKNRLTGSLDRFLLNYDPSLRKRGLINFDVSGNQLSGTIPSSLFLISSLDSIALSVNCFEGELPESICDAVNVSVLSLDGLGASSSCKKQFIIPLTSVSVGRMMKGSIPDCIWRLSNLESLHLAGNGLRGRIGGEISANAGTRKTSTIESAFNVIPNSNSDASTSFPIMSQLIDLTLSHNYLTGEIPNWLLGKEMRRLDLSHNKLTGDLDGLISKDNNSVDGDGNGDVDNVTRILKLGVNRLSGRLPPSMSDYSTLDILSGNLFSCDNIPHDDENSQYYVCGSSEYNQSMIVLGGVVTLLLLLFLFFLSIMLMGFIIFGLESNHHISSQSLSSLISSVKRWCESKKLFFHLLIKYLRFYNHQHHLFLSASSTRSLTQCKYGKGMLSLINGFGKSLVGAEKVFLITALTIIVFSVPLYVLKDVGDQLHVTHSHQYQWSFTITYLSGSVSGLLLMMLCLISLLVFNSSLWYQSRLLCHTQSVTIMHLMDLGVRATESSTSESRLQELEGNEVINTDSSCQSTSPPFLHESHPPRSRQESDLDTNGRRPSTQLQSLSVRDRLYFCFIFFVTIVMVGAVNGLYIWSTLQQLSSFSRLVIQISVSLFGMIWESLLRLTFPKHLKQRSYSVVWFMSLVGVLNGVVIPCVVTSLTSPSCYQSLTIFPQVILIRTAQYGCYQCGSSLLTAYIPVKIYSLIFAIIVNLIQVVLVFHTKVENYSNFLPESYFLPHRQLNPTIVLVSVVSNMVLLLSFGLSSPVLCSGICLSLIVSVSCYLIRLGRLMFSNQGSDINRSRGDPGNETGDHEVIVELKIRETTPDMMMNAPSGLDSFSHVDSSPLHADNVNGHNDHEAAREEEMMKKLFVELQNNIEDGLRCLERCKWLIMGMSCLFMTILSWDIAGDEVGWEGSYWVPLMGVGIMTTVWLVDYCLKASEGNPDAGASRSKEGVSGSFGRDEDFASGKGI